MPRPSNNNSLPTSEKNFKLRSPPHTSLGKIITYLQNHPTNTQELVARTLEARFLPFTMDKEDPAFYEIAVNCAEVCEAWGATIRQYIGQDFVPSPLIQTSSLSHLKNKKANGNKSKTKNSSSASEGIEVIGDMGI